MPGIAEQWLSALTALAEAMRPHLGVVTLDRSTLGLPYEEATRADRWRESFRPWTFPGYYWANLITADHISRLGGSAAVREGPAELVVDVSDSDYEGLIVVLTERIDAVDVGVLRRVKEFFAPLLSQPPTAEDTWVGPPLQIVRSWD